MKNRCHISLVVLIMVFGIKAYSQQSRQGFLYLEKDEETHQMGMYALETVDGCFFVASVSYGLVFGWEPGTISKISPDGELIRKINIGDTYSTIAGLFTADDSKGHHYYAIGDRWDAESHPIIFILHFDDDLNVIDFVDVELPTSFIQLESSKALIDSEGKVLFASALIYGTNYTWKQLNMRLTIDGTIEDYEILPGSLPGSLFESTDGNCWSYNCGSLYRFNGVNLIPDLIHNYDMLAYEQTGDSLHYIQISSALYPTGVILPDSSFIIAEQVFECKSKVTSPINKIEDQCVFFKSTFEGDVEKFIMIGSNDTLERPSGYQSIDYTYPDSIYLCAFQDYEPDANGNIVMGNKIFLKKVDSNLNVIWEKSYQIGPEHYGPEHLLATRDGGCLITGKVFYDIDTEQVDVFVMKINPDGTVGIEDIMVEDIRPYTYYPNPAQNELHLQYSPDVKPMQVELYDLQGRLVRTQSKDLESLSLQGLSAGTYTMRVMLEDGKVFSDKVVKE